MHGIEVIPFSAPDEAMPFENLNHGLWNLVAISGDVAGFAARPSPVVGEFNIQIHRGAKAVYAEALGARNGPPIVATAGRLKEAAVFGGKLGEIFCDPGQGCVDTMLARDAQLALEPRQYNEVLLYGTTAVAIDLAEKRLVANPARVSVTCRAGPVITAPNRVDLAEHVFDIRTDEFFGVRFFLTVVNFQPRAGLEDDLFPIDLGHRAWIRLRQQAQPFIETDALTRGRACGRQRHQNHENAGQEPVRPCTPRHLSIPFVFPTAEYV